VAKPIVGPTLAGQSRLTKPSAARVRFLIPV